MNSVIKTMEKQKSILSPQERRQRNRDRNREEMKAAILDAARAVMREEGVAALNLQEVARRVGVRAPSLYEYFPGKAAIYDALFRMGVRLSAERSERLAQTSPSLWEYARASLEHYMTFAQDYPELYQLCFERPVPGFVPSEENMNESRQLLMGRAAQIVEQGLEHSSTAQRAFVKIGVMAFEIRLFRQRQMSLEGTEQFLELFEFLRLIKMIPRKMNLDTPAGKLRIQVH